MTDTAKEDVRTRWAPHELEKVALRMVELQSANPALGDLEAVRQAQMVLDRQRVINQWQNAKRLDPILSRLRAEFAEGTLKFEDVSEASEAQARTLPVVESLAPALVPAPDLVVPSSNVPEDDASNAAEVFSENEGSSPSAPPAVAVSTQIDSLSIECGAVITEPMTAVAKHGAFDDEDIAIDFYANGKFGVPASESVSALVSESVVDPAAVKFVIGNSLPAAGDIQLALVSALGALVPAMALDKVLRSLSIEGQLDGFSRTLEKAFADEQAGVLDHEPQAEVTDAKIFVAGFSGNEQKSIENALALYDLLVWTPSKGAQAFEKMAKDCTIAVISEAMGDDVDEMLRSLKIKIVTHQGSTSRLAERIAEMA